MASKITQLLLSILVLTLGFGQLLRFELNSLPIYLHDVLVVAILLINAISLKKVLVSFKILKIFIFGLCVSWLFALTLYPLHLLSTPALYTLRLLSYLALFFLLKNTSYKISKNSIILAGVTMLTIGLTQYLLLPDMRWAQYLGWDDHLNRLTLPHYDPTFTGVMLALFLLSITHYMSKSNYVPLTMYYVLVFPALLLTYARSVWLSLFVTLMLFIKNKKIILLAVCLSLLAILALPDRFGEGTNLLRTYSINSRLTSDLEYIQRYGWSLVLGRGLNTLILDQPATPYQNHATGPNNSYLSLLSTTGILGLVGWGIFMKSLYKNSPNKPLLTFFFVASLFNNVMFYPFALLWVLLTESNSEIL